MLLTVRGLLPELLIVSVFDALEPGSTLPNARLPESPMTRVAGIPVPDIALVRDPH